MSWYKVLDKGGQPFKGLLRPFGQWYCANAWKLHAKNYVKQGLDCDEVVNALLPRLKEAGLKLGKDFVVVHSEVYDPKKREWIRHQSLELFKKYRIDTNLYWREIILWKGQYENS